MAELSGDKAYLSKRNPKAIDSVGATPYIPFKVSTSGKAPELWRKLHHFYMSNRENFLQHYHRRSNVEVVLSVITGGFGDAVRSRSRVAQVNVILCKVVCYNLRLLIQSICELGIDSAFWAENLAAQQVGA